MLNAPKSVSRFCGQAEAPRRRSSSPLLDSIPAFLFSWKQSPDAFGFLHAFNPQTQRGQAQWELLFPA